MCVCDTRFALAQTACTVYKVMTVSPRGYMLRHLNFFSGTIDEKHGLLVVSTSSGLTPAASNLSNTSRSSTASSASTRSGGACCRSHRANNITYSALWPAGPTRVATCAANSSTGAWPNHWLLSAVATYTVAFTTCCPSPDRTSTLCTSYPPMNTSRISKYLNAVSSGNRNALPHTKPCNITHPVR